MACNHGAALPTSPVYIPYKNDSTEGVVLLQLVADVADAPLGDSKPNFPTPDVNPSNDQDVFKQLGDAVSQLLHETLRKIFYSFNTCTVQ